AGLVEATLDELPEEDATLSGGNEYENGFRLQVRCTLQERREIGISKRHADGLDHLAALAREFAFEGFLSIDAWPVIGVHAHHFLDPVLRRPGSHRHGRLR